MADEGGELFGTLMSEGSRKSVPLGDGETDINDESGDDARVCGRLIGYCWLDGLDKTRCATWLIDCDGRRDWYTLSASDSVCVLSRGCGYREDCKSATGTHCAVLAN
jgi:hypothetical protein